MLLFWRIRYLDTTDKQFKDRDLWLDTAALDAVTRAAVEATQELQDTGHAREMLRYRHLFREQKLTGDELQGLCERHGGMSSTFVHDYFEDEDGNELSSRRMAQLLTGNPDAVMFPAGAKQHDIDYALADKRPIPLDCIALSEQALSILGYFSRDIREMLGSAFFKDGPGSIASSTKGQWTLETAVTEEDIRSFTTVFRRLYMGREPANFLKAVEVFGKAIEGYPLANWVEGIGDEYLKELGERPDFVPMAGRENWCFSRKRLIDVYLYTRYAHQPDERRSRQFAECLASVGGNQAVLTWLFLATMWHCAIHMRNAGVVIADFYDAYCKHYGIGAAVLTSIGSDNPGVGVGEKKEVRWARVLRRKAEELAAELWEVNGRPEGGPALFLDEARAQLKAAMEGEDKSATGDA